MNPVEEIAGLLKEAGGSHVVLDEPLVARTLRHFHRQAFRKQAPHDTRRNAGTWLVRPVQSMFYAGKTVALVIVHDERRGLCAQVKDPVGKPKLWELTVPDFRGAEWFGPLEGSKPAE